MLQNLQTKKDERVLEQVFVGEGVLPEALFLLWKGTNPREQTQGGDAECVNYMRENMLPK